MPLHPRLPKKGLNCPMAHVNCAARAAHRVPPPPTPENQQCVHEKPVAIETSRHKVGASAPVLTATAIVADDVEGLR